MASIFQRPGQFPISSDAALQHPFIHVPALANLRDVGSMKSTPSIRSKILYRAADPSNVPLDGLSQLHNDLRIRTIFDLRSEPEILNTGTIEEWQGRIAQFNSAHGGSTVPVTRNWTPVFKAEDYGPDAVAMRFRNYGDADYVKGFVLAYEAILEHGAPVYGVILKHLASPDAEGTLVHCTAGKDRTGVIVAIVLALCGVPHEDIAEEYELTEIGLSERRPYLIERLAATGAFGEGDEARAAAERMTGSKKESMLGTLKFVEQKYGSVEAYAKDYCGLTDEELVKLRARFLGKEGDRSGQASL
jgi:protein tyrosine/serine phosphatase